MKTFYNDKQKIETTFSSLEEKETLFKLIEVNIMYMPKKYRKYNCNWVIVSNLTRNGSGFSASICVALGVDPDGYEWVKTIEETEHE